MKRQPAPEWDGLLAELARTPHAHDFFALLRRVDALWPDEPRLGSAPRPQDEPLRLGQDPELAFAPSAIASFTPRPVAPRVGVLFFGLFGPMGPLPLHLTEQARGRSRNHGDAALARFADVFHHRMLSLFYRAWSQSQPVVQADRPDDDRYAAWVGALFGQPGSPGRDAGRLPIAMRHFSGHLASARANAESVEKVLSHDFGLPVRVQTHVAHWLPLRPADRTRLGALPASRLGVSAVAGSKVWDRQFKLRLHFGPLDLQQFPDLLPGRRSLRDLRDWMQQLVGLDRVWDVRLTLRAAEVPRLALARRDAGPAARPALGLSTWLGQRGPRRDDGWLQLRASHFVTPRPLHE